MKKMKISTRLIITIGMILLLLTAVVIIEYKEINSLRSSKNRLVYAEKINKSTQQIKSWTLDFYDTESDDSLAKIEENYQIALELVEEGRNIYKDSENRALLDEIGIELNEYNSTFIEYKNYVSENSIYYSNMSSTANGMLARLDKAIAMQKEEYYKFVSDLSSAEQIGAGLSVTLTKEYEKTLTSNEAVKAIQNVIESELKYFFTGNNMYDGQVYSYLNSLEALCDRLYDMYDSFAVKDAVEDTKYYIKDFKEKYDAYKGLLELQQAKKDEMRDLVVSITEKSELLANAQEIQMEKDMRMANWLALTIGIFSIVLGSILAFSITRSLNSQLTKSMKLLSESASQISHTSSELAASSQHLSEGSTEQAASIEETSATMDETSSMVKQNADHTRQANTLSSEASISAEQGSSMVKEMNDSMDELRDSSAEIAKIIKVIDDIAFQTNMLALNAAVEAARAGDAGLGFAVVAQEVRNLAGKSADAAKNTADIIDKNIELSKHGVVISDEVGIALEEIMSKTRNVNQIISEISRASEEQAKGTEQVTVAIGQMEKVVQNNATTAEQSATSAKELKVQAKNLQRVVGELNKMLKGSKGEENKPEEKSSKRKVFSKIKNLKMDKVLKSNKNKKSNGVDIS